MTVDEIISCDREVQGGTVVFAGTRVPLKNLIDYLDAGDSLQEFLDDFPSVTREQAVAALQLGRDALVRFARSDSLLAEKMSALMAEEYLEARAAQGSRKKFERVLAKVPDVEPDESGHG